MQHRHPARRSLDSLAAIILCALSSAGCFAARVPHWSETERLQLAERPLDLTVAVADRPQDAVGYLPAAVVNDYPRYSGQRSRYLAGLLDGAFRMVSVDSTDKAAQLVVESRQKYCNAVIVPLWTILTLGIVPTVYKDSTCTELVFRRRGEPRSSDSVVVIAGSTSREVLGLLAAPLLLVPRWTLDTSAGRRRHKVAVRLAIIAKREELERLAARSEGPPGR